MRKKNQLFDEIKKKELKKMTIEKDNCLLGQDVVNLTQKMGYENGSYWSKTQFDLEFDVFRFPQTGSLKARVRNQEIVIISL